MDICFMMFRRSEKVRPLRAHSVAPKFKSYSGQGQADRSSSKTERDTRVMDLVRNREASELVRSTLVVWFEAPSFSVACSKTFSRLGSARLQPARSPYRDAPFLGHRCVKQLRQRARTHRCSRARRTVVSRSLRGYLFVQSASAPASRAALYGDECRSTTLLFRCGVPPIPCTSLTSVHSGNCGIGSSQQCGPHAGGVAPSVARAESPGSARQPHT